LLPELLPFGRPDASDLGRRRPDGLKAPAAVGATVKGLASGRQTFFPDWQREAYSEV